jgi:hypothetical protein
MTARRDKGAHHIGHKKVKLRGAPREHRRAWQSSNRKSWSKRPGKGSDGWA